MMPRIVPNELVDQILNNLQDDQETLKQCCLVAHAWLPRSRFHLFSQTSLFRAVTSGYEEVVKVVLGLDR